MFTSIYMSIVLLYQKFLNVYHPHGSGRVINSSSMTLIFFIIYSSLVGFLALRQWLAITGHNLGVITIQIACMHPEILPLSFRWSPEVFLPKKRKWELSTLLTSRCGHCKWTLINGQFRELSLPAMITKGNALSEVFHEVTGLKADLLQRPCIL